LRPQNIESLAPSFTLNVANIAAAQVQGQGGQQRVIHRNPNQWRIAESEGNNTPAGTENILAAPIKQSEI
jgi:hypothetical protein